MSGMSSSRRAAVFALARWLETAHSASCSSPLLPDGLCAREDRAFVQDLVYETVRRRRTLEFALRRLVKHMPRGEMEAVLLAGAAQILFMDGKVPPFAAVNETVSAARPAGRAAAGFANAVLRNCVRRREELLEAIESAPAAVRLSFPDALAARFVADFGAGRAEAIMSAMNEPAGIWISRRPPAGFEPLRRGLRVEDAPGYAEGEFVVQDPATAGAIELLDVRPDSSVLDFCAAPGGKSVQIFWRLGPCGRLFAAEINETRRKTLEETLARTARGAENVQTGAKPPPGALFDRVLVDAPCSNTGVLRRRPDARWRWSEKKTRQLAALQAEILDSAARFTAPGGVLVYSTCSIDKRENDETAAAFAASHPDFEPCGTRFSDPSSPARPDGAYACRFKRSGQCRSRA